MPNNFTITPEISEKLDEIAGRLASEADAAPRADQRGAAEADRLIIYQDGVDELGSFEIK